MKYCLLVVFSSPRIEEVFSRKLGVLVVYYVLVSLFCDYMHLDRSFEKMSLNKNPTERFERLFFPANYYQGSKEGIKHKDVPLPTVLATKKSPS